MYGVAAVVRCIVEQQFAKAVMVVLKTRAYVDSIKHTLESSRTGPAHAAAAAAGHKQQQQQQQCDAAAVGAAGAAALELAALGAAGEEYKAELIALVASVSERSVHLARAIKKALLNLPSSQVTTACPPHAHHLHLCHYCYFYLQHHHHCCRSIAAD